MTAQLTPYRFRPFEPGIFVEVYLPKRSSYQGTLYETLTTGFDWKNVQDHFSASPARRKVIDDLLKDYTEYYDPISIGTIEQFFWGYSMYEVDGVFFSSRRESVDEERTQVIRFMFFPDLDVAKELVPKPALKKYGSVRRTVSALLKKGRREREAVGQDCPKLKDYVDHWIGAVGLFIFGYFIFNLTERIRSLYGAGTHRLEEEIWVTSLWSLEVNKVELRTSKPRRKQHRRRRVVLSETE